MMDALLVIGMFAIIALGIWWLEHGRCPVCKGTPFAEVDVKQNRKVCNDHWVDVIDAQYNARYGDSK